MKINQRISVTTYKRNKEGVTMGYNAYFKSNNLIERQISNLAYSPFYIEGRLCISFEGFYQGIKRNGDGIQDHIFQTFGMDVKNRSKPTKFVYFKGLKIRAGVKSIMTCFYKHKFVSIVNIRIQEKHFSPLEIPQYLIE